MQRRIALIGASGYTGIELTRRLANHPFVELAVASSDRWVGQSLEAKVGVASALRYVGLEDAIAQAASCEAVLLATPAEASHELVPRLLAAGRRVIDLSGAYRLRDASLYPRFYKYEHQHAGLLAEAVYGLPELGRENIASARLVANPGCYATAIQLALAPLVASWNIDRDDKIRRMLGEGRIVVDAMSGVTGAGRKAAEEYSFAEIAGDLRAYRTLRHQHLPEIEQALNDTARREATRIELRETIAPVEISFVPHLLPVQRGILATCHVPLVGWTEATVRSTFEGRYASEPFVVLAPSADDVSLHDVVGTNRCKIGVSMSERGELVVTAAIDNLVKGAAGQAVQNLNLMLGVAETTALANLRGFHP
jgi:N-acetyl-gamma-glutamyl-phosphate reductase